MTYSDLYGDSLSWEQQLLSLDDEDRVLNSYRRWLHKVVNLLQDDVGHPDHDDLVQEGYVAMWKALQTYDPARGAISAWLTTAARMRMKDCLRTHCGWTGQSPAYGGGKRPDEGTTVMSLMDDDLVLEEMLGAADLLESVEVAYHRGEILRAVSSLTPSQRRYVVYRFWLGWEPSWRGAGISLAEALSVKRPDQLWVGARTRLRSRLGHLQSAVS